MSSGKMDTAAKDARLREVHTFYEPPESVQFSKEVFGNVGDRELTLEQFTPKVSPTAPRPAIVFAHGGCWRFGKPNQFSRQSGYLADKYNFFAVSVDYRLSEEAPFPAGLQDVKCAIRWVRSQAEKQNIDPNRIAVAGGSAGGHLSAMTAVTSGIPNYEGDGGHAEFSSAPNAAILLNGEFDLWDLVEKGSLIEDMKIFLSGTPEEIPDKYTEVSPIKRVHKDVSPTLFLHGDLDRCVSYKQSLAMQKALLEVGAHSEIEIFPGKKHAWFNHEPDYQIVLARMEKFLVEQFGLPPV